MLTGIKDKYSIYCYLSFLMESSSNTKNIKGALSILADADSYAEQYRSSVQKMKNLRQTMKEQTLANGGKWSIIQDFANIPSVEFPVCACTGDNFNGILDIVGITQMYEVYPRSIVDVLNNYYSRFPNLYEFSLSDVDTIITRAFPEHPDMIAKRSFMELSSYDFNEVKRRMINVLKAGYAGRYAYLHTGDDDDDQENDE